MMPLPDNTCGYNKSEDHIWTCWRVRGHDGPHVSLLGPFDNNHVGVALYDDFARPVMHIPSDDEEIFAAVGRYLDFINVR